MMNGKELVRNTLRFCIPSIVSAIVGILILPLISRIYPEAEYGYISNFYSVGNLLMSVVLLGLDSAYIRYFNEPPTGGSRKGLFFFAMRIGLGNTICLFGIVLLFASDTVTSYLFNDTERIGLLLLGLYTAELVVFRMFHINMRFSENAKIYNLQQVGFILGNRMLFVLAALFSTRYIYSVILMTIAVLVVILFSLRFQYGVLNDSGILLPSAKKEVFRFAVPVMPATILVLFNTSAAKLILGGAGMRDDVGIFAIATSAANVFSMIPSAFGTYWGAFMYKYYKTECEMIKRVHGFIMLLSICIVAVIIIFQDLLYLILGVDYRISQIYFMLIMLMPITQLLGETTSYGVTLAKKTKYVLYTSIIACLTNVLVCGFLVPYIGAIGAAIGIAMSATVNFLIRTVVSQRYYQSIDSNVRTIGAAFLLWGLCIGNTFFYDQVLLRSIICIIAISIALLLYRHNVSNIWHAVRHWLQNAKNA